MNCILRFSHFFIVVLAAWVLPFGATAATLNTQLERSSIMAGETTGLSISVEGGTPSSADSFPPIDGLTIQYRGASRNFTSVNGQSSFTHVLNFAVGASKPGQYVIPSIRVVVDGTAINSQPVTLTVTEENAEAQNRYAFLRLTSSKKEVYVGEVFPIEIQLYVTEAEDMQAPQLKSEGFVIHKQAEHTRSRTQVG